ncbi:MAG: hypothetical protein JZU65_10755 [Chlorobium sp.]|nr:hypothetical protein [Chlorobium sp.]
MPNYEFQHVGDQVETKSRNPNDQANTKGRAKDCDEIKSGHRVNLISTVAATMLAAIKPALIAKRVANQ